MPSVPLWSGREVRALREARRMSVREFAGHLGVSDRMVSKWEAGGETIRPRPLNQAALDTSLAMASPEIKSRFTRIALGQEARASAGGGPGDDGAVRHLVRHPLDGKLMTMVDAGPFRSRSAGTIWLAAYYIDVYATSNADYGRFLAATDHLPPISWGGRLTTVADDPVVGITWEDVLAYGRWATKASPTADEWDRAARGAEGMVLGTLSEWCATPAGPGRRGHRSRDPKLTGFRCACPASELLNLLAI
jgi:hypothetical protein